MKPSAPRSPRQKRALSQGGPVVARGRRDLADLCKEALALSAGPAADELTHGFHAYPARFHPFLARKILETALPEGGTVLDPFVGSGTTLVEAMTFGARAIGSDVNPLAVLLSRVKATPLSHGQRAALMTACERVTNNSRDRIKARARTRQSGDAFDDPRAFAPHVFRELVGLREEIEGERDARLRELLLLCLSSIIVKVSRRRSDTDPRAADRAVGKGLATRFLGARVQELVQRMEVFSTAVPRGTPPVDVRLCDARKLSHVKDGSVHLIITSPPYPGTYDYAAHHAHHLGWVGLDASKFGSDEIGSRRKGAAVLSEWQRDVDAFVAEMSRTLDARGLAFIVSGDSAIRDLRLAGDTPIIEAARRHGMIWLAQATQARRNFYTPVRQPSRNEHLIVIGKSDF